MGRRPRRRRYNPYEPKASLSLFEKDRMHYSMFDVGPSMFDVHQFLFRLNGPLFLADGWAEF
jgi:hypothetical protein